MITEMVKAHLENVKSLLNDLETQKTNIQNEVISFLYFRFLSYTCSLLANCFKSKT